MPHLDDGQLTALLDGELTSAERAEAESHLANCPACRELLDETRRFFREAGALVDAVQLPTDSSSRPAGPNTPAGLPDRRTAEPPTRRGGGLTAWRSLGWAATIVVAVGLGWFASDLRYRAPVAAPISDLKSDRADQAVMTAKSAEPTATTPAPATHPVPSDAARAAGNGAISRPEEAGTRTPAIQAPAPEAGLVSNNAVAKDEVGKLAESGGERREAAERAVVGSTDPQAGRPAPAALAAQAPAAAGAVQTTEADLRRQRSNVRTVTLEEAVRSLGGTIRLVDGMVPARVEVVESAEPGTRRIRVVYFDPPGRELWLDQARQLADSRDAYRALDDRAGLLVGDTIAIAGPAGRQTLNWIDQTGLRLGLTGFLPADSLRGLARRVR
ncbi:MAG: zf-HC2 domain-containing protein [Gemmatimonadota bacterium]|nr:zf-HC2 domain-containing protein [Gemmatimonadota bacterium]